MPAWSWTSGQRMSLSSQMKMARLILSQIIQNALKYFDKPKKVLSLYSEENDTSASLVIRDNGCGISASDLPRIFEKGFTGSDRTKNASTGMGLYLAKTLCDRLGLGLAVESREGEFTKVTVIFPKGQCMRWRKHQFISIKVQSRSQMYY